MRYYDFDLFQKNRVKVSAVRNYKGKSYFIDSALTFDAGYETMVFMCGEFIPECDEAPECGINYSDLYCERYEDKDEMLARHNEIVSDFDSFARENL